jgi:hypothetical protein
MELWIRSQDKMNLVKVRQVGVNYQNNKQIIANYTPELYENSGEFVELLGIYKTKERALEVLDEINDIKLYKYMASLDWNSFVSSIYEKTIKEQKLLLSMMNTYQMPKE